MKYYILLAVFFTSHLMVAGELSEKELKRLREVEIGGVRVDTWKNNDREKFERLEVDTSQNMEDPIELDMTRFRMRLIVELTDRQGQTYLVQFTGNAPEYYESEYQGEDHWRLHMAHGNLERFKTTAYAIQYGFMDGKTFVPLAEVEDDSDEMLDRVRKRTTLLFPGKVYLWHSYMYDDSNGEVTESDPKDIKNLKK